MSMTTRPRVSALAGLCALALAVGLAGCGNPTQTVERSAAPATTTPGAAAPARPMGPNITIADYVDENNIIETPVKPGDTDSPKFDFPIPPDWQMAGTRKPEWAYGAIVYGKPADPADPPFITAIVSKLTGDVDAAKVLQYAPGMLQNLPGYTQDGDVQKSTLSGFEAIQFQGSYLAGDVRRYIAQKTVVIPAAGGGVFVLQLNADAPIGQDQVIRDAANVINEKTVITA